MLAPMLSLGACANLGRPACAPLDRFNMKERCFKFDPMVDQTVRCLGAA